MIILFCGQLSLYCVNVGIAVTVVTHHENFEGVIMTGGKVITLQET